MTSLTNDPRLLMWRYRARGIWLMSGLLISSIAWRCLVPESLVRPHEMFRLIGENGASLEDHETLSLPYVLCPGAGVPTPSRPSHPHVRILKRGGPVCIDNGVVRRFPTLGSASSKPHNGIDSYHNTRP